MNVYNPQKILLHLDRIKNRKPICAQWDITNKCNLNCYYCSSKIQAAYNITSEWDLLDMQMVAEQLKNYGIEAIEITGGGEPTIHPDIIPLLQFLLNDFKVALVTNGTLLENKQLCESLMHLTWVRVSVDDRKIDTTHIDLIKSSGCFITTSFVITPQNYHLIVPFAKWSKEKKFDGCRYTPLWPHWPHLSIAANPQIESLLREAEKLTDNSFSVIGHYERFKDIWKPKKCSICYYSELVVTITANGSIHWCCATKNEGFSFIGNLLQKSLADIWSTKASPSTSLCPPCYMDAKNNCVEEIMSFSHGEFV